MVVSRTEKFGVWLSKLRDRDGRGVINARIKRLAGGNRGDARAVGGGVMELRINTGPGYRVYYMVQGIEAVLLLCGGNKSSQDEDIAEAQRMAKDLKNG